MPLETIMMVQKANYKIWYIWLDLYLTRDLNSTKCSVSPSKCLPDLYSILELVLYAGLSHRAII